MWQRLELIVTLNTNAVPLICLTIVLMKYDDYKSFFSKSVPPFQHVRLTRGHCASPRSHSADEASCRKKGLANREDCIATPTSPAPDTLCNTRSAPQNSSLRSCEPSTLGLKPIIQIPYACVSATPCHLWKSFYCLYAVRISSHENTTVNNVTHCAKPGTTAVCSVGVALI